MRTYKVLKISLLRKLLFKRKRLFYQLTVDPVISHTITRRRLYGKYTTGSHLRRKPVIHSGTNPGAVLSITGQNHEIDKDESIDWPEFREYARMKYSTELDDDLITMIEDLIERRRSVEHGSTNPKMGN